MKEKQHILCSTYTFSGDKIDDIKVIKKIIFQLFFPYLYFEDLDSDYVNELRKNFPKIKDIFWNFVFLLNSHPSFPFCKRVSHFESDLQILYPTFHFCNDFPVFFLAFMI